MCLMCRAGFHAECETPAILKGDSTGELYTCCCYSNDEVSLPNAITVIDSRTAYKDNSDVRDATSTGRKRAVALYPIPSDGMECEWSGLSFAGGGTQPIIGCRPGTRIMAVKRNSDTSEGFRPGAVHHGPDKSTLNNEPDNVSRICVDCHNRWHALNDPFYARERPAEGAPYLPLSGVYAPLIRRGLPSGEELVLATAEELEWSDKYWSLTDKQRKVIPYRKAE